MNGGMSLNNIAVGLLSAVILGGCISAAHTATETLGKEVRMTAITQSEDHAVLHFSNGNTIVLQNTARDQSPPWFKATTPSPPPPGASCLMPPFPASKDLSANQTPFRSQGSRDTCTEFTMVAATEAAYKRLYKLDLDLSEQYLNHVQNANWLADIALPAAEIHPDTFGGGNLLWHAGVLQRYGLPEESTLPYIPNADYESTPAGLDDPHLTQRTLDDYDLSAVTKTYMMPEPFTATIWPQAALETARYRPTVITWADGSQIHSTDWYRSQLACDQEVMIQFWLSDDPTYPNDIWTPGSQRSSNAVHAVLIVGYDDSRSAFQIKNSAGGTEWFSYDWITRAEFVTTAGVVTDVAQPSGTFDVWNNKQLFLGRWNLDHDGWHGTLDLYRIPRTDGDGNEDWRIGTYFGPDGVARRVNGKINGNRIDFLIDWNRPDQPWNEYDPSSALHFTGYIFSWNHLRMAGTMLDNRDGNTYGFHAQKSDPWTGVPGTATLGPETLSGTWNMEHDGWKGRLIVDSVNRSSGAFSAYYVRSDGQRYTAQGKVGPDPRQFSVSITFSEQPQQFAGFIYGQELQLAAGTTTWAGIPFGFAMVRIDDDAPPLKNQGGGAQQCNVNQKCCESNPDGSCSRCISKSAQCP